MKDKRILDACCGGRMFWFDRARSDVLFVDNRVMPPTVVGHGKDARVRQCQPDVVMDFRRLDLPSEHFALVVFDPPHLFLGETSYMAQTYGRLERATWRDDLRQGFSECFRVLRADGVLIFKWSAHDIPLKEILPLSPCPPLFGHLSGKAQMTHWIAFMKPVDPAEGLL